MPGVASEILDYAKGQISNIRMDTHKDNIPMQHFMKKKGFQHVGTIFLANGDPRLAFHLVNKGE